VRSPVVSCDIQADATDTLIIVGLGKNILMHGLIDSPTTLVRDNIHTLDPPKYPVPPITPFEGDHELSDGLDHVRAWVLGNDIKAIIGV
jgi:hypothetical protein